MHIPAIIAARDWLDPFEVSPIQNEEISFSVQLLTHAVNNFDGDFTRLYGTRYYTSAKSTVNDEMRKFIEHIIDPLIDHISEYLRHYYEETVRKHNSIIILFSAAAFAELDVELETELMGSLTAGGYRLNLIKCPNIASAQSLRDDYQLIESYFDAAQLIYPERSAFDLYDLHFAERLKSMTDQEGPALSQKLFALHPIRQCGNYSTLLETLAVYLLDADKNLQRASEILNVHKNTVRYRIKQIRDSYACDITQMPLASELYEEVALQRLLHNSN